MKNKLVILSFLGMVSSNLVSIAFIDDSSDEKQIYSYQLDISGNEKLIMWDDFDQFHRANETSFVIKEGKRRLKLLEMANNFLANYHISLT